MDAVGSFSSAAGFPGFADFLLGTFLSFFETASVSGVLPPLGVVAYSVVFSEKSESEFDSFLSFKTRFLAFEAPWRTWVDLLVDGVGLFSSTSNFFGFVVFFGGLFKP